MTDEAKTGEKREGERIAKVMARAGVCSRRDAEKMIAEGRVTVNGAVLQTPATLVTETDKITVDGKPVGGPGKTRLWLYHKPAGLVTTHHDEHGRETIFDALPERLPRVISVGRLDLNSEGLLLLTNDGALSRSLELPSSGWERAYRVRAFGDVDDRMLEKMSNGMRIDGVQYAPIRVEVDKEQGANVWLTMTLTEGKNREIRRVLEHLGLSVNRLIRVSYGPFELGRLERGDVEEVPADVIKRLL